MIKLGFMPVSRVISHGPSLFNNQLSRILRPLHSEVSYGSDKSIELKWNAVDSVRSYRVEFSREPDGPYNMQVVASPSLTLRNLVAGAKYKYTVSSINGLETSSELLYSGNFATMQVS